MLMRVKAIHEFGGFRFDPEQRLLMREARRLELSPKALEVLGVLLRNAGRIVSKDHLLEMVWPDTAVEEGNLPVHIFALRRALGDSADTKYIETIPRRGYRFVAPISFVRDDREGEFEDRLSDPCVLAVHYMQQQTSEGCRRAAAEYGRLLDEEPESLKARLGLVNTLLFRLVLGELDREEVVHRAWTLLREAEQIDSGSPELLLSRSRLLWVGEWQRVRADQDLQCALERSKSAEMTCVMRAWRGFNLVERGDAEKGLAQLRDCKPGGSAIHFYVETACRCALPRVGFRELRRGKPGGASTASSVRGYCIGHWHERPPALANTARPGAIYAANGLLMTGPKRVRFSKSPIWMP